MAQTENLTAVGLGRDDIEFLVHSFHRNNGSKTARIFKKNILSHICNKKENSINQRLCTQFSGVDFLKVPYAGLFM